MSRFSLLNASEMRAPDAQLNQPGFNAPSGPGIAEGLAAGADAFGRGIESAGQIAQQKLAIEQRRYLTNLETDTINAATQAQLESKDVDNIDGATAILDKYFEPLRAKISGLEDKGLRDEATNNLTRTYDHAKLYATNRAFQLGVANTIPAIDKFGDGLMTAVRGGTLTPIEASVEFGDMMRRHAVDLGPDVTQKIGKSFRENLAKTEWTFLPPDEARVFLDSEFAKSSLDAVQIKSLSDRSIDDQRRQQAQLSIQAGQSWSSKIDALMIAPAPPSQEQLNQTISDAAGELSKLSVDPRSGVAQISESDAALMLVKPHLIAASERGDTVRFALAASAAPKTAEAQKVVADGQQMLGRMQAPALKRAEISFMRDQVVQRAAAMLQSGQGVIDSLPQDELPPGSLSTTVNLSDGTTHTFDSPQVIEAAVNLSVQAIHDQSTPETFVPAVAEFLGKSGQTYRAWSEAMNAGFYASMTQLIAMKPGDPAPAPPANLAQGYELYKRIGAIDPRVRNAHMKNESTRRLYEIADLMEQTQAQGDSGNALALAMVGFARVSKFGEPTMEGVDQNTINSAVDDVASRGALWWSQTAQNQGEIRQKLLMTTKAYMMTSGASAEQAMSHAVETLKQSHAIINDWAVDVSGTTAPPNFEALSKVAIDAYVAKFGEQDFVNSDQLTLIPGETPSTWIVWNKGLSIPADHFRDFTLSNADLQRLGQQHTKQLQDETVRQQNRQRSFLSSVGGAIKSLIAGDSGLADVGGD